MTCILKADFDFQKKHKNNGRITILYYKTKLNYICVLSEYMK